MSTAFHGETVTQDMITYETSSTPQRFLARLQNAGIEPGDSEELRLNKSLLMLATGSEIAA